MINREFIENLKPAELELISSYIYDLVKKKVTPDTANHENIEVSCCPECGSIHFVKNGHNLKGRQKYLCKDCKKAFVSTTDPCFTGAGSPTMTGPLSSPQNSTVSLWKKKAYRSQGAYRPASV